jgi:hypothetical protein
MPTAVSVLIVAQRAASCASRAHAASDESRDVIVDIARSACELDVTPAGAAAAPRIAVLAPDERSDPADDVAGGATSGAVGIAAGFAAVSAGVGTTSGAGAGVG